jgi:quinol monooxygenase YgiN
LIREHAQLSITPGEEAAFEAVLPTALDVITSAPGCHRAEVHRGIESPSTYLLLVWWDSVEAHQAFRGSERFAEWRGHVQPHWAELPHVEHFDLVAERDA